MAPRALNQVLMCSECDWKIHEDHHRIKMPCDCGNQQWVLTHLDDDEGLIYRCTKCDALHCAPRTQFIPLEL